MELKKIKFKKAALELSIGTIVILVIAMSMLILGLILVRTIFKGATESVNILDEKVRDQVIIIFAEEEETLMVNLGGNDVIRVKPSNTETLVSISAQTLDGSNVDKRTFKYKLSLDENARENCIVKMRGTGGKNAVEKFISQKLDEKLTFDETEPGGFAFAKIGIQVPDGTPICSQKVFIELFDESGSIASDSFSIQVIKKGFF